MGKSPFKAAVVLAVVSLFVSIPTWGMAASIAVTAGVTSALKVHLLPAAESPVIGRLRPGDPFTVSGEEGDWLRVVLTPDIAGFVSREYVTVLKSIPDRQPQVDGSADTEILESIRELSRTQALTGGRLDAIEARSKEIDRWMASIDAWKNVAKPNFILHDEGKWFETFALLLVTSLVGLFSVNAMHYTQVSNIIGRCHDRWSAIMQERKLEVALAPDLRIRFWDLQHEQFAHFRRGLIPIETFEYWMTLRQKELVDWEWSSVEPIFNKTGFSTFMTNLGKVSNVPEYVQWSAPGSIEVALYLMLGLHPRNPCVKFVRGVTLMTRKCPKELETKAAPPKAAESSTKA